MSNARTLNVTTPSDIEIVMTRVFDAPPGLVFEAYTKPAMLRGWLGGVVQSLRVCERGPRIGGGFRGGWVRAKGKQIGESGTYGVRDSGTRIAAEQPADEP